MSINPTATNPVTASGAPKALSNKINPLLETGKDKDGKRTGEDHFSFWDVLDIVNPLQHIPIISNIYRKVTGDQISNVARIAGDTLYGGAIGAAFGVANAIAVHKSGGDIGDVALTKIGLLKSQEMAQKVDPANAVRAAADRPDLKDIPMVEIHPSNEARKDEIIWDKPVQVAAAQPGDTSSLAMPSPKDLNDIAPGANNLPDAPVADSDATKDPSVSKKDVQKNMLEALNKYKTLQEVQTPNAIIANPAATAANAAPKNIFAMPAGAPVNMAQNDVLAARKPSAAFNKLRHYSN